MTIKRVYDGLAVFLAFALGWLAITATAQAEMIETITYYHNDLTGSPVAATDEQGNVIWRKEYSPYGEELNQEQQPDHRGFTGHVHDADLGLTYMQARYYDPTLGRFLAVDPAAVNPEVPFSFNRYAYANNNPYKFMDPDGRVPILIPVVIFVGKEIAFEVIERQTGFTPPSLKNGGKYLLRKGFSEGAKKTFKESAKASKNPGRQGKQQRLRELGNDDKVSSADRGWIKQEINSIERGNRKTIRNPPGKDLAHERGREAAKGYGYEYSHLQDRKLHRTQHKYDNFGKKNKERPPH